MDNHQQNMANSQLERAIVKDLLENDPKMNEYDQRADLVTRRTVDEKIEAAKEEQNEPKEEEKKEEVDMRYLDLPSKKEIK